MSSTVKGAAHWMSGSPANNMVVMKSRKNRRRLCQNQGQASGPSLQGKGQWQRMTNEELLERIINGNEAL